jgi:hypothetical protein
MSEQEPHIYRIGNYIGEKLARLSLPPPNPQIYIVKDGLFFAASSLK